MSVGDGEASFSDHHRLQLYCTLSTPARDMLDIWPSLTLLVYNYEAFDSTWDPDIIVAALQHSDPDVISGFAA